MLSHGQFAIFNLYSQEAGNYLAEGQWAPYNPLVWLISLAVYHAGNYLLVVSILKITMLVLLAIGGYLLAKTFYIKDIWSFLIGISLPNIGFTKTMDSTTWVTGLMVFVLIVWFWWIYRVYLTSKIPVIIPFVFGYLLITVGYVYGTLFMVFILAASFFQNLIKRDWKQLGKTFILDVTLALVTFAVYLPGVLTGSVTDRTSGIVNGDFFSPTLVDLFAGTNPGYTPDQLNWFGTQSYVYVSFLLLLLVFVKWSTIKTVFIQKQDVWQIVSLGIISFFLVFGPEEIGVLRFPARSLVYLALVILLAFGYIVSNSELVFSRKRFEVLAGISVLFIYLSWSQDPQGLKKAFISGAFIFLIIAGVIYSIQAKKQYLALSLATVGILGTSVIEIKTGLPANYGGETTYKQVTAHTPKLKGQSLIVGSDHHYAEMVEGVKTLVSNYWYIGGLKTQNVYTPTGLRALTKDVNRLTGQGDFSIFNLPKIFKERKIGKTIADLMSYQTIQVVKPPIANYSLATYDPFVHFEDRTEQLKIYRQFLKNPPKGWEVSKKNKDYYILSRITPVPKTGLVTYIDNQAMIKYLKTTQRKVVLKINSDADVTKIYFSRMAWPGYEVSGDSKIVEPLRGYLLGISVPKSEYGKKITVEFNPPFLKGGIISVIIASFIAILGSVLPYVFPKKGKK
jgi:hypothetical protein